MAIVLPNFTAAILQSGETRSIYALTEGKKAVIGEHPHELKKKSQIDHL